MLFNETALHGVRRIRQYKQFNDAHLRILWKRFQKHSFISQSEAEELAEMMNVSPERIRHWFKRQRNIGALQQLERVSKGKDF